MSSFIDDDDDKDDISVIPPLSDSSSVIPPRFPGPIDVTHKDGKCKKRRTGSNLATTAQYLCTAFHVMERTFPLHTGHPAVGELFQFRGGHLHHLCNMCVA